MSLIQVPGTRVYRILFDDGVVELTDAYCYEVSGDGVVSFTGIDLETGVSVVSYTCFREDVLSVSLHLSPPCKAGGDGLSHRPPGGEGAT